MRIFNGLALNFSVCIIAGSTFAEPTFQSIIDSVQTNAERRADLLRNSSGTCTLRLQREVGEDRPVEKIPFSTDNFQFAPEHTAQVSWMQRGDALRFDIKIPEAPTPSAVWSPFPPQNTRTLLDGHRSVTYDVSADSVIVDKQPSASVNPIAILYRFEPNLLYRFRGDALHQRLKNYQSLGWTPNISEQKQGDTRLLTVEFNWKRGDHGRDREGRDRYTFAPDKGYALVEGSFMSRHFYDGKIGTSFEGYDATYKESPEQKGVWLLSHLRHLTDTFGTLDSVDISFDETRIGVQIPESNFTTESLGVKDRTPTLDRRIPSVGTTTELP